MRYWCKGYTSSYSYVCGYNHGCGYDGDGYGYYYGYGLRGKFSPSMSVTGVKLEEVVLNAILL